MYYLAAFFLIGFAILFHEFGHFLAARMVKIPIKTFSVGFGPAIWKKQWGQTEYRISWIPMGGYVLPAIENETDFFEISVTKRMVMTAGGPIASAILPIFCFAALNCYSSGFTINGILIAPIQKTWNIGFQMFISLSQLFAAPGQFSGIIGIVAQGGHFVAGSLVKALQFLAVMSINFFVINVLPIPALDGGKILLFLTEKLHPSFVKLHIPLSLAGWVLIAGLTLYTVVADVLRFVA